MRQQILTSLRVFLGGSIILAVVVYSIYTAQRVIKGPRITLVSPTEGQQLDQSLVVFTGVAERAAKLTLNGREISIDKQGNFREELLLSYGYNVMEVMATDRSGKTEKKTLQLFYK